MEQFDFVSLSDKPALVAVSTAEWRELAATALQEQGFKVHIVENHAQFLARFHQANYQVIIMEEMFAGSGPGENESLIALQQMPMNQRRHAVVLLIGDQFETLSALEAFAQSVHCVVNHSEMDLVGQLVQRVLAQNNTFLATFREMQQRALTQE
jgi:DNA-binding NtrC family response regulator